MSVSVIMPALNEAENIQAAVQAVLVGLDKWQLDGEVLVIDDGSTDQTSQVVKAAFQNERRVRLIQHKIPWGMGGGFWDGVQQATKDSVVMIPGDGENDPEEILRYLPLMREVDLIVPYVCNPGVRPWGRRILSFSFRAIVNFTFGMSFNYTNGTVVYRRAILDGIQLKANGFFYQTELLVRTVRAGYLFAEVPVWLRVRLRGQAKALKPKSFLAVMKGYLQLLGEARNLKRPLSEKSATYRRVGAPGTTGLKRIPK